MTPSTLAAGLGHQLAQSGLTPSCNTHGHFTSTSTLLDISVNSALILVRHVARVFNALHTRIASDGAFLRQRLRTTACPILHACLLQLHRHPSVRGMARLQPFHAPGRVDEQGEGSDRQLALRFASAFQAISLESATKQGDGDDTLSY